MNPHELDSDDAPPLPPKRSLAWFWILLGGAVVLIAGGGVSAWFFATSPHNPLGLRGSLVLTIPSGVEIEINARRHRGPTVDLSWNELFDARQPLAKNVKPVEALGADALLISQQSSSSFAAAGLHATLSEAHFRWPDGREEQVSLIELARAGKPLGLVPIRYHDLTGTAGKRWRTLGGSIMTGGVFGPSAVWLNVDLAEDHSVQAAP